MKILTIVGARPQFIKAAVVSRVLCAFTHTEEILVHTGQHYDVNMSEIFFEELEIPKPNYNLGIGSGSHGAQTGKMLAGIEEQLLAHQPDWMLVYGDTNSTLAGALAAVKLNVPVAHVEAGLRSFNRQMPEEINRILTDHASDLLFAPTQIAVNNLSSEGIVSERVHLVGDVMYDAALYYGAKAEQESRILQGLDLNSKNYILATVHRAENTDVSERLHAIFEGLIQVAEQLPVVLPLHPRTRLVLERDERLAYVQQHLQIIAPVGYLDMLMLEQHARLIATDSGGVQKEAFFYQVPCVTLRDETEWVELVENGWNRLCSPLSVDAVTEKIMTFIDAKGIAGTFYGDGTAAQLVVQHLLTKSRKLP